MRRKVNAERRSTRRSVQIVVPSRSAWRWAWPSSTTAYLSPYDGVSGQFVLVDRRAPVRGRDLVDAQAGHVRAAAAPARHRQQPGQFPPPNPKPSPPGGAVPHDAGGAQHDARSLTIGAVAGLALFLLIFAPDPAAGQAGQADRRLRRGPRARAMGRGLPGGGRAESAVSQRLGAGPWPRSAPSRAGSSGRCAPTSPWSASPSRTTWRPRSCSGSCGLSCRRSFLSSSAVGRLPRVVHPAGLGRPGPGRGLLPPARPGAQAEGGQAGGGTSGTPSAPSSIWSR